MLLRDQLTGIHLHSVANAQKAKIYVCNYLTDNDEKAQYNQLFKEHILDVVNGVKGKCRGSIFVQLSSSVENETGLKAGRFLTFSERDHLVVHELMKEQ